MRTFLLAILCAATSFASVAAEDGPCGARQHAGAGYIVCRFSADDDIRLFLKGADGEPYGHFSDLNEALEEKGQMLLFAMNAGMYHEDRAPVGLYIEEGEELARLNTNDGPGNFHMKPNGVFFIDGLGAHVLESKYYLSWPKPGVLETHTRYATQSGPMLVIDGEIHPRFLPRSQSLKRRNGVGVTTDGDVYFVLADGPVRFYDFAVFFRDELGAANALYLDGTISRIYAPDLGRNDPDLAMGPIVGVVAPK